MPLASKIFLWLSIWSVLLPAFAGAIKFSKLKSASRIIWLMTAFSVVSQLSRYVVSHHNVVYNIYMLSEFALTVFYFWIVLAEKDRLRRNLIIPYSFIFLTLYFILANVYGFGVFFSELVCLSNVFVLICILICYYTEVKTEGISILSPLNPHFLYFAGWMIYVPITLLMFSLWNFLERNPDSLLQNLWIIHSIGNIGMYLLFALAFVIESKNKKILSKTF